MTMKSTLIVPLTLLAALAAGVLVHDRPRTKSFVQDPAPTRTASIATAKPADPAPLSPPPVSAFAPATPEPEPPRRMTASQEASLDAWMIKTYLACWKPAPEAAEARQSAVRSGAEAAGKERVAGCQGMRPFTDAGSISLLL
jgi:hypothetical protein